VHCNPARGREATLKKMAGTWRSLIKATRDEEQLKPLYENTVLA